jgi:crotonobetainyl-CoA:carnitine CoA-transferase CaiB-like acyl-CoA transferase
MSGALDGIRVIDFGQYLAGPLAALLLADQGAEVIRVDPPGGPRWRYPANAVLQRGKRSIVLDLKRSNDLANRDPMQARRRVCASVGIPPKDCRVPFRSWLGPARPQG